MSLDADPLVKAQTCLNVKRQAVSYEYEDVTTLHEESVYVLVNESQEAAEMVALPPRAMEVQPDMTARIDGRSRGSIVPSQEVQRRLLKDLDEHGLSREGTQAWEKLLEGGLPHPDRQDLIERARQALDGLGLEPARRGFYEHVLQAKLAGKYVPFVALPDPVEPGRFVLVEFTRRRLEEPDRTLKGRLAGRYEVTKRFPVGVGHSIHLSIDAPPGTLIKTRRTPPRWPDDAGVQLDEATRWNLYLSVDAKQRIHEADPDADPITMDGLASLTYVLPMQVHIVSMFLLLLLALVPRVLFQEVVTSQPPGMPALIGLFILTGGIYIPVLMSRSEQPPAFRYMLKTGALMAMLALWWVGAGTWRPEALAPLVAGVLAALSELGLLAYNHA